MELCGQMNERSAHRWFLKGNSEEFYTRKTGTGDVPHPTNNEKPSRFTAKPCTDDARLVRYDGGCEIACCRNILRPRKFCAAAQPKTLKKLIRIFRYDSCKVLRRGRRLFFGAP